MLCLLAHLIIWLSPLKCTDYWKYSICYVFVLLSIVGTYLAYSPVVRHLEITMDKRVVS